jgi:hypothetical protein
MSGARDWRYETKYVLKADEPLLFYEWLINYPDLRPDHPSRRVNSIYFDTPELDCAQANLDGISRREKFRLRWYGSEGPGQKILFEIKSRRDRMGTKISHPIAWPGGDPAKIDGATLASVSTEIDHLAFMSHSFGSLQPTLAVSYERAYYVTTMGVRMTVDTHLAFQDCNIDIPNELLASQANESTIVEFKFARNAKEQASHLMAGLPFSANRSSKYLLGLSLLGNALYI